MASIGCTKPLIYASVQGASATDRRLRTEVRSVEGEHEPERLRSSEVRSLSDRLSGGRLEVIHRRYSFAATPTSRSNGSRTMIITARHGTALHCSQPRVGGSGVRLTAELPPGPVLREISRRRSQLMTTLIDEIHEVSVISSSCRYHDHLRLSTSFHTTAS